MPTYARTNPRKNTPYRDGYLRSTVWFRRRDAWFEEEQSRAGSIRCAVCNQVVPRREAELHHLDYSGVRQTATGMWEAGEEHADLVACHKVCHDRIHQLLDRDIATGAARSRRAANVRAIQRLRHKYSHPEQE